MNIKKYKILQNYTVSRYPITKESETIKINKRNRKIIKILTK